MGTLNLAFRPRRHQLGTDRGSGERMSNCFSQARPKPSAGLLGSLRELQEAPGRFPAFLG